MFTQKFAGKIYLSLLAATFVLFVAKTTVAATKLIDVAAGASPSAVAVNAASNKIYIANNGGSTVTVIDGATRQKTDVTVGLAPVDIGVHPALNRVYVVNRDSDDVTVLQGDSNAILATIPVGDFPLAVAVNPITNRVYVVNNNSSSVTVIDALTNTVLTTVAVLNFPGAIAVNTVTDKIYVANSFSGKVTRILGASNTAAHINVGGSPSSLAVNQTTNKIYVTNETDSTISVIDGATDAATATVSVGALPHAVAVNPVTNKIYVANSNSTVSIINGATVSVVATAATAAQPGAIAVNATTNQIFTANSSGTVTVIDGAANAATGSVTAGNTPHDIAVNPVTNEVFVSNINGGNVSVIEDAADSLTTIPVIGFTTDVAVNPVTGKAYVGYESQNIITVIRPDNTTANINLPTAVQDIAVNPITNRIYAALTIGSAVVIDGATDSVVTNLATGVNSTDVEVNAVTNKIYVSNTNGASVTVIDGATNAATNVSVLSGPRQVVANPATNKIYVPCNGGVSVIDGATNAVTNINLGTNQISAIAVNPLTNKIYAAGGNSINAFVIDGATNAVTTVTLGASTGAIGVEVSTHSNKAYFFHALSSRISVINGATNAASPLFVSTAQPIQIRANPATGKLYILRSSPNALGELDETTGAFKSIPVGTDPRSLDFNPLDGKLYVANRQSPSVSIIAKQNRQTVSPAVSIPALTNNTTNVTAPTFLLGASGFAEAEAEATDEMTSDAAPSAVNAIYFQADTLTGRWRKTNGNAAMLPPLKPGLHILYAFAADGQDSTTTNTGSASSPLVGKLSAYLFRVVTFTGTRTTGLITTPGAGGAASPYPSVLTVAGVPGAIEKISVRLGGMTHGFPLALDILLVSPSGQKMILMSDAGSSDFALSDTTLTFDDAAPLSLPFNDFIGDGTFKPTNFFGGAADLFPAPAPPAPYQNPGPETGGAATLNGTFAGETANGDWKLFVIDDTGNFGSGSINNWSLTFQTTSDCPSSAYQISPSSANFNLSGGEGSVNIAAPEGCAWTAASNNAFVSIFSEAVGSGGGAINYSVAPSINARTGTMTIAGQTFTVNQAAVQSSFNISGVVRYGTTPSGAPAVNVSGVSLSAIGSINNNASTDSAGAYSLVGLGAGAYTVTPTKAAETTNTGISLQDASEVARYVFNQRTFTANQIIAADATGNGSVSLQDASEIAKRAFNVPSTNIVGQWKFAPETRAYANINSNLAGENYEAILVGDVTGNWTPPPINRPHSEETKEAETDKEGEKPFLANQPPPQFSDSLTENNQSADRQTNQPQSGQTTQTSDALLGGASINLPNRTGSAGTVVLIPVTIGDLTGRNETAYDFTVSFDPKILQPSSQAFDTAGTLTGAAASGYTVIVDRTQPTGKLRVGAFGTTPLAGSGVLIYLRFNVLPGAAAKTQLDFERFVFGEGNLATSKTNGTFKRLRPPAAAQSIAPPPRQP